MTEIGGPSQVPVDEMVDKHVVLTEQSVVEPVLEQETYSEDDPEEDHTVMAVQPVRGGVMRFGDDNDEEMNDQMEVQAAGSEDSADGDGAEDDEEGPLEAEAEEYHDDMGTTADDIIEELTTRNGELEDRVHHLEEQNQVHQDLEQQYKDVAYQALGEKAVLEEIVGQKDQRIAELQAQLIAMSAEYDMERMDRANIHEAWVRAATRVDEMETEIRATEARVDRASLALTTAFGRLRSRVRRYGRERHRSRRVISRCVVDEMVQQEHESAMFRADL